MEIVPNSTVARIFYAAGTGGIHLKSMIMVAAMTGKSQLLRRGQGVEIELYAEEEIQVQWPRLSITVDLEARLGMGMGGRWIYIHSSSVYSKVVLSIPCKFYSPSFLVLLSTYSVWMLPKASLVDHLVYPSSSFYTPFYV